MPNNVAASLLTEALREATRRADLADSSILDAEGKRYSVAVSLPTDSFLRPDPVILD